jgi:hypothetical protein
MSNEFAMADYTGGQMNAIIKLLKKQGGEDGPERFLRGDLIVTELARRWTEKDGVITFTLPLTDGTTGPDWIIRTEKKGNRIGDARQLLLSADFQPTTGVVYKVTVLKGKLFSDEERVTSKIRSEAKKRKLQTPNAEVACLIRENFSDEELEQMGLWYIAVMHESIKDSDGKPRLLDVSRSDGGRWLSSYYGSPDVRWSHAVGFAFVVQQVSL